MFKPWPLLVDFLLWLSFGTGQRVQGMAKSRVLRSDLSIAIFRHTIGRHDGNPQLLFVVYFLTWEYGKKVLGRGHGSCSVGHWCSLAYNVVAVSPQVLERSFHNQNIPESGIPAQSIIPCLLHFGQGKFLHHTADAVEAGERNRFLRIQGMTRGIGAHGCAFHE